MIITGLFFASIRPGLRYWQAAGFFDPSTQPNARHLSSSRCVRRFSLWGQEFHLQQYLHNANLSLL